MNFRKKAEKEIYKSVLRDQQDFVIDEVMRTMKTGKTTTFTLKSLMIAGQPERHQSEGYDRSVERDAIMRSGSWTLRDNYKSMYGL
jgi:predicted transcriptional regulator